MFGAIFIVYLDELMSKYGVTSGINLFIASGVSYAIVAGTFEILLPEAIQAIQAGGAAAVSNAVIAFGPLFFAIIVFLVSIYIYEMKVELPLAFEQLRGIGGRLPIPFLYVSVLPVILASSLELSFTVWFRFLSGVKGSFASLAKFIALYTPAMTSTGATNLQLTGGITYLISPSFPLPYSASYGWHRWLRAVHNIPAHNQDAPVLALWRLYAGARVDACDHLHCCACNSLRGVRQVLGRPYRAESKESCRADRRPGLADTWLQKRPKDS